MPTGTETAPTITLIFPQGKNVNIHITWNKLKIFMSAPSSDTATCVCLNLVFPFHLQNCKSGAVDSSLADCWWYLGEPAPSLWSCASSCSLVTSSSTLRLH